MSAIDRAAGARFRGRDALARVTHARIFARESAERAQRAEHELAELSIQIGGEVGRDLARLARRLAEARAPLEEVR